MKAKKLRHLGLLTVAAVVATTLTGPLAPAAGSPGAAGTRAGTCHGVRHCHRIAVVDIDGDRRPDRVGWRRLGAHRVRIRVRTDDRRTLRRTVHVRSRVPAAGTARLDGHPGAELLIGSLREPDSRFFTMLTYRRGTLVVEANPAPQPHGRRWGVASSVMRYAGWHRHVWPAGRITMTLKVARRDGDSAVLRGYNLRYEWRRGDWHRARRVHKAYRSTRRAARIAGWHAGRLDHFPWSWCRD